MTMTPEPTGKLDAAASRGERTRGRDQRTVVISADLHGLLEPDAGRLARPVLRGAERREALGLPDQDGRCQTCNGTLHAVADRPQNPGDWERWLIAHRIAITMITIPVAGTTGVAEPRLIHADCLNRSGPTPLPAPIPSGLA